MTWVPSVGVLVAGNPGVVMVLVGCTMVIT